MSENSPRRTISTKKKTLFAALVTAFVVCLAYLFIRSHQLYTVVAVHPETWNEAIHQTDPELGFAPVPDSTGALRNQGFPVPVRYDRDGFRVPIDSELTEKDYERRPFVMALGCSFTFGDACKAEDTYPYVVAHDLGGRAMNAGICSYGLAQMVLRAEELIPRHKPDYVIVQYSPWLVWRSQSPFAPSVVVRVPAPFYVQNNSGLVIQPPLYRTNMFNLKSRHFIEHSKGIGGYLQFVFQVGLAHVVREDGLQARMRLGQLLGTTPSPTQRQDLIVRHAYGRIQELCQQVEARMLIVMLGAGIDKIPIFPKTLPEDVPLVNAHALMLRALVPETDEQYKKEYGSWLGTPPNLVFDEHPNPKAHRIIADAILSRLTK